MRIFEHVQDSYRFCDKLHELDFGGGDIKSKGFCSLFLEGQQCIHPPGSGDDAETALEGS